MSQPKQFIRKKVEVAESGKVRIHGGRVPRPDRPAGGAVFLLGVPGSGREELGRALAAQLGLPFLFHAEWSGEPAVVAADDRDLAGEGAAERMRAAGTVFYLLDDVSGLAERLARRRPGESPGALRAEAGARLFAAEPGFMAALHFLLQGARPVPELLEDVLERLRL